VAACRYTHLLLPSRQALNSMAKKLDDAPSWREGPSISMIAKYLQLTKHTVDESAKTSLLAEQVCAPKFTAYEQLCAAGGLRRPDRYHCIGS
jgi:hypothetical protein